MSAVCCFAADCVSFTEASNHIGKHRCVTGKVWDVKDGNNGVTFLDFCEDYRVCPFTVVVSPGNLKDVGDVRELKGKTVQISGEVKSYDDRAEIVLSDYKQLKGEGAHIPPLPKGYDVEKKGHFSAGKFKPPKAKRRHAKRQKRGVDVFQPEPASEPED